MSSPNISAGLVQKMSLPEMTQKLKKQYPDLSDLSDADVAVMYLQKFPDQVSRLNSQDQSIAQKMLSGGDEKSIAAFYKLFGNDVLSGVSLANAPEFVKPILSSSGTKLGLGKVSSSSVGHVDTENMKTIFVDRPTLMDRGVMSHESVHIFQNALREPMKSDENEDRGREANYDYGGWQGLIDAQGKHRTIRNFTDEQQAEMVGDYVRLQDELQDPKYMKKTPEQKKKLLEEWDLANRAMAPYLRQLAGQPKDTDLTGNIFHLGTIDTKPPVVGPAPASLSGIAIPLPEIGGKAAFISIGSGLVPKEKKTHSIEDVKTKASKLRAGMAR